METNMPMTAETGFAIYLYAINGIAFAAFWLDKRRAEQGGWRIPEKTLLALALVGGSAGAMVGQQALRHKTRKQPFRVWLLTIAGLHVALGAFLLVPTLRKLAFEIVKSLV